MKSIIFNFQWDWSLRWNGLSVTTHPATACSKLTVETVEQRLKYVQSLQVKTSKRRQWRRSGVFIVNFEHTSYLAPVFYC